MDPDRLTSSSTSSSSSWSFRSFSSDTTTFASRSARHSGSSPLLAFVQRRAAQSTGTTKHGAANGSSCSGGERNALGEQGGEKAKEDKNLDVRLASGEGEGEQKNEDEAELERTLGRIVAHGGTTLLLQGAALGLQLKSEPSTRVGTCPTKAA